MININMTVEIDILADDVTVSKSLIEHEVMSIIADRMKELFKYPLSSNAELLDLTVYSDNSDM